VSFSITIESQEFNRHVADFMRKSTLPAAIVIKKFAFDLLAKIIKHTPVDTGRARGGWLPAMERLAGDTGKVAVINISGGSKNFDQQAVEEGKTEGDFIDNTNNMFGREQWVEIINGVEYVIYLEYGHSQQAPYGMVRLSMREIRGAQLPQDMVQELKKVWNSFY